MSGATKRRKRASIESGTLSPNPWDLTPLGRNVWCTVEGTRTEDRAPQGCDPSAGSSAGMARGGFDAEAAPKIQTRHRRILACCGRKMVLTMGSTLHLHLEVVSRLRKQLQDSEKGPGVLSGCGLLTGDTSKPGITRILDFESLQTLDAASVEAATGSASADVVGFYRTTPIGSPSMPDEDKALAASLFRHPSSAFLLIEAGKSGIGEARFCFWGQRELFDWPMMLFPFDAEELASKEWRRRSYIPREPLQSSYAGLTEVTSSADKSVGASPEVGHGTVSAEPETQPVSAPEPFPSSSADHRQKSTAPEPVAKRRQEIGRAHV